jgi:hypothetical protein
MKPMLLGGMKQWLLPKLIFEKSHEELLQALRELEKIRHKDSPETIPVDYKKRVSVISSVGKPFETTKSSKMLYHYCEQSNHNTADSRAFSKFKQHKKNNFEAKLGSVTKSLTLCFILEEINALKRQLKPEKTISSKQSTKEGRISPFYGTNLRNISDEGEE